MGQMAGFRAVFLTSNDGIIATKIFQLEIYDRKCIPEQYILFHYFNL